MSPTAHPLLEVRDLSVSIDTVDEPLHIVEDVGFTLERGRSLGLIGESGSGKSITALSLIGLLPVGANARGRVVLDGADVLNLPEKQLRSIRGSQISMIFQEPMTALDPVFTIGYQLCATLRAHEPKLSRQQARERCVDMLEAVGIPDPRRRYGDYPHQLSGGMRQRVMIAMALITGPSVLIADEPTTAVDITIQAQLLALLAQLSAEHGTSVLLISHDIGVVAELCDEVAVMYAGQIVERGPVDRLLHDPAHPYTSGLLHAAPRVDNRGERLTAIRGRVPPPEAFGIGCRFSDRCDHARHSCAVRKQVLTPARGATTSARDVRCERHTELDLRGVATGDTDAGRLEVVP